MVNSLPSLTLSCGPLTLRPFQPADIPAVIEAGTDPLIPLVTTVAKGGGEAEALAFIERQHERLRDGVGWSLAIADSAGKAVGQIGLWPKPHQTATIGYWLTPSARGKGYAAQALACLSAYGLTQFARLELYIEPWNEASWRTAERAGYQREGLLRKHQDIGGVRKDMYLYALLPSDS